MSGEVYDDYGNVLDMGNSSGFTTTTFADPASDPNTNFSTSTDANSPVKAGDVFKNQTSMPTDLSGLSKFIADNKGLILGGGALAGLMGAGDTKYGKTGYQGTIPRLAASRTMITAPPTRAQGYRPGAGGIDYGGDVSYTRMPAGTDPWAGLSGTKGTAAGANLTTVPTNISNIVTNTGGTDTKVTNTGLTAEQQAIENWRKGLTPQQYLSSINQWLLDNPNASKEQIAAAMAKYNVSPEDLQTALGETTFSDATKYALTHGSGLQELNSNISNWLAKNPYATNAQIQAEQAKYGVSDEDVARAMNGLNSSAAKEYAVVHDMGLDQLYKNILDYQAAGHTPEEIAAAMAATGVEQRDINNATKYATENKYTANPTSAAAVQNFLNTTQAAVPAHSFGDSVEAILAEQKALGNPAVNANLANLGLGTTNKVTADDYYQPEDNTDYSYMQFAEGGMAKGRYLQGATDGMADELPAQIGESQPAALSHGEFVVPADVVSHLGNGNSDAGAKKLYQMMDKIRMARTGSKKQGKKINPDKFMPGGLAASKYATGGKVKHFLVGGATGTSGVGTAANAGVTGVESNLSNWAGDYVTNMLGQGQALANLPYTAYMGPLTAGESPLQTGAFKTASGLTTPTSIGTAADTAGSIATKAQGLSYTPTTTSFDATQAASYMNPYLKSALEPQLAEARRQSQITQQANAAKMTQAGAFGGGRQAILDAETQRALGANLANITGTGYSTAYDKAMQQFNADQARKAQEAQFGATYGLQGLQTGLQGAQAQGQLGATQAQTGLANLKTQLDAGAVQRGIESEGIAADKAAFEEARANPYKMVQFQQSLLQGLPLAAQSYNMTQPSTLSNIGAGVTTAADLLDVLLGKTAAKKAA